MGRSKKISAISRALGELSGHEQSCRLCPRECGVDRLSGETGDCGSGSRAGVGRALLHYGEEPILSGMHDCGREMPADRNRPGSGALFFTGCSLKCLFCQNHQISWSHHGRSVSDDELAGLMLDLQSRGAYNINLVSPTHVLLPVLRALRLAVDAGLKLPVVHNSSGYEKAEVLRSCRGVFDVYLPDLKYRSADVSFRLSRSRDYFAFASTAVLEMSRQQPRIVCDGSGIALRGCLVRHLALPGLTRDSLEILDWLDRRLPSGAGLSLMSQYLPTFLAPDDLRRPLSDREYTVLIERALEMRIETLFIQPEPFGSEEHRNPDFERDEPFQWE